MMLSNGNAETVIIYFFVIMFEKKDFFCFMSEVAPFGEVNNISKTDVLMLMPKIVGAWRAHYNKTQEKIIKSLFNISCISYV